MIKLSKNENGFSAVEVVMAIVIVILIGAVGYLVYKNQHKTTVATTITATKTSTASKPSNTSSTTNTKPIQQHLTISEWGARIPYNGTDSISLSDQSCTENGDANGDTVNLGCQVTITSQDLANSVGSCTAKVSGKVGYFYKLGTNDNYGATNGSGYTPVAQWAAQNPGQYTQIGNYYYAFATIGKATGLSGAAVADSNQMNGNYTGCSAWQAEYNTVSTADQALASKFEAIPN